MMVKTMVFFGDRDFPVETHPLIVGHAGEMDGFDFHDLRSAP